jgi:hypothetical protein
MIFGIAKENHGRRQVVHLENLPKLNSRHTSMVLGYARPVLGLQLVGCDGRRSMQMGDCAVKPSAVVGGRDLRFLKFPGWMLRR